MGAHGVPTRRFWMHSLFFPLPWVLGIPGGFLLAPLALLWAPLGILAGIWVLAAFSLLPLCLIPTRLVVGNDGVERRWLFWRRFVAASEIRVLHCFPFFPALLMLHDGRRVFLPLSYSQRRGQSQDETPVFRAIEALIQSAHSPAAEETVADRLARRDDETAATWLKRLTENEVHYRVAPIASDVLWSLVEDPHADATARAGAALTLARANEADTRERIASVAANTANSKLRVVLESAAAGAADDAIAEKLDKVPLRQAR